MSYRTTFKYEDFPEGDTTVKFFNCMYSKEYIEGRTRHGKISNGKKEGQWLHSQQRLLKRTLR